MELKETISLMCSSEYKERFKAEYYQTKTRYEKLKHFNNLIEAAQLTNTPEPNHDCPFVLLMDQIKVMEEYLHILEIRAAIESIELN